MNRKCARYLLAVFFLLALAQGLLLQIRYRSRASVLTMEACVRDDFREQDLPAVLYEKILDRTEKGGSFGDLLTSTMLNGRFHPDTLSPDNTPYLRYKQREYVLLRACYEAVWEDLSCFPIPGEGISYEDSWLARRTYGGERRHEGTDLFGEVTAPGYYPVLSMTDGKVEQKGWLPLGGYRIGIRSEHGGYFYYAHLSAYEKDFQIQEEVKAGDILGYMGDSGYGPEGTRGQFPVHLHLGIYISPPGKGELSVNPYRILKALEKNKRNYTY